MNLKKILATSLISAVLVGTAATSAHAEDSSSSSSSETTTCLPDGAADTFPTWVENAPRMRDGVDLWHDTSGWHLRVKHATPRGRVFSGAITTDGELNDVAKVRLERGDDVKLSADKHMMVFRFHNYGHIDGFNFQTICVPSVTFRFVSNGHKVPTTKIWVGSAGTHPASNPFTISRSA